MQIKEFYTVAERRHPQLGKDVVHDLYCQFGEDLPKDAYLRTCIKNARPDPLQQTFDSFLIESPEEETDPNTYADVANIVNGLRDRYPLEIDTFLECCVNSSVKAFSDRSGVSISVLQKICTFVKYEILREFYRLKKLD
jgi:hypothetical protein